MRALFLTLPAAMALAACVEVDMTVEILGDDEARVFGYMQLQRQAFDMSGADASFCPETEGGTLVLTETHARCEIERVGTFAEIMDVDAASESPTDMQGQLTALGDNRVRVMLPLGNMTSDIENLAEQPEMLSMVRQMMEGMSISLSVQGRVIESSNGRISADGTRATYSLDVDDLLVAEPTRLEDFVTVARH